MRARRALLYMPGDDFYKINKGATLGVDTVCMDMEDGVAYNRKDEARGTIVQALNQVDFGQSERLARINPVGSGLEQIDLDAVLPARPDGIVVPKVRTAAQLHWVDEQIARAETHLNVPLGSIALLAIIESAVSIVNLAEIAGSVPRLEALIFGSEDFASDLGAVRTREAWEVFYARSAVVTYAAAFQLQAIDMVYVDFRDSEGLHLEALEGARLGFSGKQVIHPNQVPVVQIAYTPTDEAIDHALRLIEAFQVVQESGSGAFAMNGKMVDAPMIKAAENILTRARAAGKLPVSAR
jgi:citrate lyase subunit beta-like protein